MEPTAVIEVMGTQLHEEGSGEPVLLAGSLPPRARHRPRPAWVGRNPWFRRTTLHWIRRNRVLLEGPGG